MKKNRFEQECPRCERPWTHKGSHYYCGACCLEWWFGLERLLLFILAVNSPAMDNAIVWRWFFDENVCAIAIGTHYDQIKWVDWIDYRTPLKRLKNLATFL